MLTVRKKGLAIMSEDKLKIICPFCNEEWTAEMETELLSMSEGCETCGHGAGATVRLEIKCSNCGRVVYVKEGVINK